MNPVTPPTRPSLPFILGLAACGLCCTLPFLVAFLASTGIGAAALAWWS